MVDEMQFQGQLETISFVIAVQYSIDIDPQWFSNVITRLLKIAFGIDHTAI